jgi:hypothetical protein
MPSSPGEQLDSQSFNLVSVSPTKSLKLPQADISPMDFFVENSVLLCRVEIHVKHVYKDVPA